jgi:hypothetical protein
LSGKIVRDPEILSWPDPPKALDSRESVDAASAVQGSADGDDLDDAEPEGLSGAPQGAGGTFII